MRISETERAKLEEQRKAFDEVKRRMEDIQARLIDGVEETDRRKDSMNLANETIGSFMAAAFSMRGATSVAEKIASSSKDTAKNTKDTLLWLRQQDFGVSFS